MTRHLNECDGRYVVVGRFGEREYDVCVLAAAGTRRQAEELARRLRAGCERYSSVTVEDLGER